MAAKVASDEKLTYSFLFSAKGMLVFVLWLAVVFSGLLVVEKSYHARVAIQQLETLRKEGAELQVETGQLMLEKSSLVAYSRIETKAVKSLGMYVPQVEEIIIVKINGTEDAK